MWTLGIKLNNRFCWSSAPAECAPNHRTTSVPLLCCYFGFDCFLRQVFLYTLVDQAGFENSRDPPASQVLGSKAYHALIYFKGLFIIFIYKCMCSSV